MSEKRLCVCGEAYWWPKGQWQHAGCAINTQPAINEGAINNESSATNTNSDHAMVATVVSGVVDAQVATAAGEARTANRRDRKAYNAYQRGYMKKRRADKKAGRKPLGIAHG